MRKAPIFIYLFFFTALAFGQTPPAASPAAKVIDANGIADKQVPGSQRWQKINAGDLLTPDTSVRTGANSAVLLVLADKHNFRIGEGTLVRLKELGQNHSYSFEVVRGRIWSFVDKAQKPAKYEVETPSVVLGVTGTLFSVVHNAQNNVSNMSVDDGTVSAKQGDKTVKVSKGYQLRLTKGQATPLVPQKHDAATQAMWKHMRENETWTTPNAQPHINPQTEQTLRTINQTTPKAKAANKAQAPATKKQPAAKTKAPKGE